MTCDRCDNEATVHEVTIQKGNKVERHLCESCAAGEGIAVHGAITPEALVGHLASATTKRSEAAEPQRCTQCGLTYAEFRQHGLLGCPECYHAFEEQLVPLLERAHEGAGEHVGKTPQRSVGALQKQRQIAVLRKNLATALAGEHYERAAELRDELHQVGGEIAPGRGVGHASAGGVADPPAEPPS